MNMLSQVQLNNYLFNTSLLYKIDYYKTENIKNILSSNRKYLQNSSWNCGSEEIS